MNTVFKNPGVFLLLAVLFSPQVTADDLAKRGDKLGMMQKIQGAWRDKCRPIPESDKWKLTKLVVSYTHFTFKITEYKSRRCISELGRRQEKYLYSLGQSLESLSGQAVFAVDFKRDTREPAKYPIYPKNIIRYEKGQLLLGKKMFKANGQRLVRLNSKEPYVR